MIHSSAAFDDGITFMRALKRHKAATTDSINFCASNFSNRATASDEKQILQGLFLI